MKKIQKLIIWIKRNIYYFLFIFTAFFLCLVLLIDIGVSDRFNLNFSFSKNFVGVQEAIVEPSGSRTPSNFPLAMNPYMIPAGTQMVIPPWVLEQYELSQQQALYGDVLNFLIYNYGVAAPSADDSDVDTYYIPLTVYDSNYSDYDHDDYDSGGGVSIAQGTVMVDVTKLQVAQPDSQPVPGGSEAVPGETQQPVPGSEAVPGETQQPVPGSEAVPGETQQPVPGDSEAVPGETQQPVPGGSEAVPEGSEAASDSGSEGTVLMPRPRPRPEPPGGIVIETTEDIDTSTSPSVPAQRPEEDLTETYPATCDKAEEETEASGPCVDCVGLNEGETNSFLNEVSESVQNADRVKRFSSIPSVFCEKCHGVDVGKFFQHIEQRANEEKVPAAIMFAFMLRESNGDCNAGGDSKRSFGLFQLNITNSTKLKPCAQNELSDLNVQQMADVCKKGQYRKEGYPKAKGRCLNNPYCNFEEAIHLLKEKWDMTVVNKGIDKPTETDWVEMGKEGRNLWRNAIIAYNGAGYLASAEHWMKEKGLSSHLDNWEIKRMFFVKSYLYNKSDYEQCGRSDSPEDKRCRAQYNPEKIIHNLAYVERITGREKKGGLINSSMCQWVQFDNNNPDLSCNK